MALLLQQPAGAPTSRVEAGFAYTFLNGILLSGNQKTRRGEKKMEGDDAPSCDLAGVHRPLCSAALSLMNEQKTKAECRDKDGRENTGGEILLQYNGSFMEDSGLLLAQSLSKTLQRSSGGLSFLLTTKKKTKPESNTSMPPNTIQPWIWMNFSGW